MVLLGHGFHSYVTNPPTPADGRVRAPEKNYQRVDPQYMALLYRWDVLTFEAHPTS